MSFKYTFALAFVALMALVGSSSAAPLFLQHAPLQDAPKVEAGATIPDDSEEIEIFVQQVPDAKDDAEDDEDVDVDGEQIPIPQEVLDALIEDLQADMNEAPVEEPTPVEAPIEEDPQPIE